MSRNANLRVLRRCEAVQMVTDLNDVIENVIMMAEGADNSTKVVAMDTLVLVQIKRNILEREMSWAESGAAADAERDLETMKQAAARKGGVS